MVGTTRTTGKAAVVAALGATPVVVDVFDADAVVQWVKAAAPDVIIHQLTDLAFAPGSPRYEEGLARNARLRIEGTRNLVAAAKAAGVRRLVAQSIAFVYAPRDGMRDENDPLNLGASGMAGTTAGAVTAMEQAVLAMSEGIVLRYAFLYGPGTWFAAPPALRPIVHVDAAAQAALLAVTKGGPGVYNIGEDDPGTSSEKAKREFGFDAAFRIKP